MSEMHEDKRNNDKGSDAGKRSRDQNLISPTDNPLNLAPEDWAISPWANLKQFGVPSLEQVRTYKQSLESDDGPLFPPSRGPSCLCGLITHFAQLSEEERPLPTDFDTQGLLVYDPYDGLNDWSLKREALVLFFLAELHVQATRTLEPAKAELISCILSLQVEAVRQEISLAHSMGAIEIDDPMDKLQGTLLECASGNPLLRKYLPWILSESHEAMVSRVRDVHAVLESIFLSEPDSEEVTSDAELSRKHFALITKFVHLLHPSETPHAPWHSPAEEVLKLLAKGSVDVDLRLQTTTPKMCEGSLHLLKSIFHDKADNYLTIDSDSDLVSELYEDIASAGPPISTHKIASQLVEYLNSSGSISVFNFLGVKPSSTPVWGFVRGLREQRESLGGHLTIEYGSTAPGCYHGILLRQGVEPVEERKFVSCVQLTQGEARPGDLQGNADLALGEAAKITVQKYGGGPFGFCGVNAASIELIEQTASPDGKGFTRDMPVTPFRRLFGNAMHSPDFLILVVEVEEIENETEEQGETIESGSDALVLGKK